MYMTTCWIYETLEMDIRTDTDAIHIGLRCPDKDTNINVTLGKEQAITLVTALTYTLQQIGTVGTVNIEQTTICSRKEVA